jgi:hypothetical protein
VNRSWCNRWSGHWFVFPCLLEVGSWMKTLKDVVERVVLKNVEMRGENEEECVGRVVEECVAGRAVEEQRIQESAEEVCVVERAEEGDTIAESETCIAGREEEEEHGESEVKLGESDLGQRQEEHQGVRGSSKEDRFQLGEEERLHRLAALGSGVIGMHGMLDRRDTCDRFDIRDLIWEGVREVTRLVLMNGRMEKWDALNVVSEGAQICFFVFVFPGVELALVSMIFEIVADVAIVAVAVAVDVAFVVEVVVAIVAVAAAAVVAVEFAACVVEYVVEYQSLQESVERDVMEVLVVVAPALAKSAFSFLGSSIVLLMVEQVSLQFHPLS